MALHPHRQDRPGNPGRDTHPPAIGWGIEFVIINGIP
jgi:hypothetical protein